MCRFVFYHGPPIFVSSLVTEPSHSLIQQSVHSQERKETFNGDGFGLAWYPDSDQRPALFRSIAPAWNNANLLELARVIQSTCVLAHVRAASQVRAVAEANCHPFTHGQLAMMHNGDVGGFARVRRKLIERLSDTAFDVIGGSTDSEHLFALFVDALAEQTKDSHQASAAELAGALRCSIVTSVGLSQEFGGGAHSFLNVAVTNGRAAAVSRFTTVPDYDGESLYMHRGLRYICVEGACRMVTPDDHGGAVIVSSERLSDDPGWEAVPRNHLVIIHADRQVELQRLDS